MYVAALVAFTVCVLFLAHKKSWSAGQAGLALSAVVFLYRVKFAVDYETGPDASIWLASAFSVSNSSEPIWWLLTSNEGRPFTVLPLVVLHKLGMPLSYAWADMFGVLCYCLSFMLVMVVIEKATNKRIALYASLPAFFTLATCTLPDYISYNCQAPSLLATAICLLSLQRLHQKDLSKLRTAWLGILLGSIPFIKFQNIPAGLCIGLVALGLFIRRKDQSKALILAATAMIPAIAIGSWFMQAGQWETFTNDFFYNYAYYGYILDQSGEGWWHRFSPRRIAGFLFGTADSAIMLAGLAGMAALAIPIKKPHESKSIRLFACAFLVANLYAILQSGWNTPHYLLYLWLPLTGLAALQWAGGIQPKFAAWGFMLLAIGQFFLNSLNTSNPDRHHHKADKAIVDAIKKETLPTDKIVVWGHADRFYVMAKRSMGTRLADNWWIIHEGPTQAFRVAEFISDLKKNKPVLIVDNTHGPDPHRFQFPGSDLMSIAPIAGFVQENYYLSGKISGALFYRNITR